MRDAAEYRRKAAEFAEISRTSTDQTLRDFYRVLAREYRDLAVAVDGYTAKGNRREFCAGLCCAGQNS